MRAESKQDADDGEPEHMYPGGCLNPRTEALIVRCLLGEKRRITLKRLNKELRPRTPLGKREHREPERPEWCSRAPPACTARPRCSGSMTWTSSASDAARSATSQGLGMALLLIDC